MWVLAGGRLTESVVGALVGGSFNKRAVIGVESVDDILETLRIHGVKHFDRVSGFVVFDAAVSSLKNWDNVREVARVCRDKPLVVVSRYRDLTPDPDSMGGNVIVECFDGGIPIGVVANLIDRLNSGNLKGVRV
ncbi:MULTISPECIES: hypothetical protein [Bacillus amyloliquefaciens group]|uniref:hypothetical protein n=1 Tax=Bacillus amyloliquefaciens group TaxID=1938374 RepID=UPI00073BD142|nr:MULTISPECIES: hypothetical protein [Bacillus amyloliquefaciens group]KTF59112.1 hypothetical protein AR691_17670 [Bacillus amyloliquefaciens]